MKRKGIPEFKAAMKNPFNYELIRNQDGWWLSKVDGTTVTHLNNFLLGQLLTAFEEAIRERDFPRMKKDED
jgi:hypothetical protein